MQEHPTFGLVAKNPTPLLITLELLVNQVAEAERSWKLFTPFELNCPWAQS